MLLPDSIRRNVFASECCKAGLDVLPTNGFPVSCVLFWCVLGACHRKCGNGFESDSIFFIVVWEWLFFLTWREMLKKKLKKN
jgi:hypothetical protein